MNFYGSTKTNSINIYSLTSLLNYETYNKYIIKKGSFSKENENRSLK